MTIVASSTGKHHSALRVYIALHAMVAMYSLASVCSKLASAHPFMSLPFVFFYGGSIAILGIYAIGWQQVIKRMPLTAAYANKAVTLAWGLVWGKLIFGESFTAQKLLGAGIVLVGVVLFAFSDDTNAERPDGNSSSRPAEMSGTTPTSEEV